MSRLIDIVKCLVHLRSRKFAALGHIWIFLLCVFIMFLSVNIFPHWVVNKLREESVIWQVRKFGPLGQGWIYFIFIYVYLYLYLNRKTHFHIWLFDKLREEWVIWQLGKFAPPGQGWTLLSTLGNSPTNPKLDYPPVNVNLKVIWQIMISPWWNYLCVLTLF